MQRYQCLAQILSARNLDALALVLRQPCLVVQLALGEEVGVSLEDRVDVGLQVC